MDETLLIIGRNLPILAHDEVWIGPPLALERTTLLIYLFEGRPCGRRPGLSKWNMAETEPTIRKEWPYEVSGWEEISVGKWAIFWLWDWLSSREVVRFTIYSIIAYFRTLTSPLTSRFRCAAWKTAGLLRLRHSARRGMVCWLASKSSCL